MHSNNKNNSHFVSKQNYVTLQTKQNGTSQDLNQDQYISSSHSPWEPPPPPQKWSKHQSQLSLSQSYSQETSVDKEILDEIQRKSELYEATKEHILARIKRNFESVIEKIKEAEDEVLDQVGIELGENPFSTLLTKVHSGNTPTDKEIKKILSVEISQNFRLDEESSQSLCWEIEAFKTRQMKKKEDILINNFTNFQDLSVLSDCVWKECPNYVDYERKYSVDEDNPRIVTKINRDFDYCFAIIGNSFLPLNKITSWNIKILKSKNNDGRDICIGVAPSDIDQNDTYNYDKYGWYFNCYISTLYSGPHHNYIIKKYGPRKEDGNYVHTGDIVGVVMDTTKGELSFVLNSINLGVAYEEIPLDKPLVPCVLLCYNGDSVELDLTSEVKENIDSSIPIPSSIIAKSNTWDSINLTWSAVEGESFYQIEVDGINTGDATTANIFTKRGLLPETEHIFRIRAIKDNSVGEWSGAVNGKTLKILGFPECVWKERPDDIDESFKYNIGMNSPRIATKVGVDYHKSTVIGNTPLPRNKVTSWSIKILKSKDNNGFVICVGVAPFDINQNEFFNYKKYGWYYYCYESMLISGPPYDYEDKIYGPRKKEGRYVHTGDSICVVMDTIKGELSFVVNGVNYGIAYEGIPLDKPLVPCVILGRYGDSVELDTSEVKETVVDTSIFVPSSIKAKSNTWDSITLTWDAVEGASFYQIEVDGSKSWDASITNTFIKRGLLSESVRSFRVRAVKDNKVGKWSGAVKGRTQKASEFSGCVWIGCPEYVDYIHEYSVNENNRRIAAKMSDMCYCTIIGSTLLPPNKITSWKIKILKSKDNNGKCIYIGVAPFDVNQNKLCAYESGWYFYCYGSTLRSGPPHYYFVKEYGPRKEKGGYVHNGDSIGIIMDTTKGELSFVLKGVNLGTAFKGIPLDKPLVPCVVLEKDDSVELVI